MIFASLLNFFEVALGFTTCIISLSQSLNYINTPLLNSVSISQLCFRFSHLILCAICHSFHFYFHGETLNTLLSFFAFCSQWCFFLIPLHRSVFAFFCYIVDWTLFPSLKSVGSVGQAVKLHASQSGAFETGCKVC